MESEESKLVVLLNSEDAGDVELAREILKNLNIENGKSLEDRYEISITSAYRLLEGNYWRINGDGTHLIRALNDKIDSHIIMTTLSIRDPNGGLQWWDRMRRYERGSI